MSATKKTAPTSLFLRPGQILFKEGEPSRSLYIIKKGTLAIRKMKGPDQIELARIYSNEVLGELSFFDRAARSASAVALTEAEVAEVPFEALEKLYASVPAYLKTIVASMAERLRRSNDTIRRLQKDVIHDAEKIEGDEGLSASEVLAATLQAESETTAENAVAPDSGEEAE